MPNINTMDRTTKDKNTPIYAFCYPESGIGYGEGCRFHEFFCVAKGCKKSVCWYLDKKDAKSTSNLKKHSRSCLGTEPVKAADRTKAVSEARDYVVKSLSKDGSIAAIFESVGKGKATYSHQQHIVFVSPVWSSFLPISKGNRGPDQFIYFKYYMQP